MTSSKNPGIAAVLSLLIPGVGQFYNGSFGWGIFWLIITPGLWIGSGGLLGWVCHVISAIAAYRYAANRQLLFDSWIEDDSLGVQMFDKIDDNHSRLPLS